MIIIVILVFVYVTCPNLHLGNSVVPFYARKDNKFPVVSNLNSVTIFLTSGLSNRIRTLLGFVQVCREKGLGLTVIWIPDATCNGTFLEYFKPIPGVTFINHKIEPVHYTGQTTIETIVSHYGLKQAKDLYCYLDLHDDLEKDVYNFVKSNQLDRCVGIHVRRSDYTGNLVGKILNGVNSDEDFCNYIKKYSAGQRFFLATDNRDTQEYYIRKYANRVHFYASIPRNDDLRKTTLRNAIIDIYLLSYCKNIKGTYKSSFSEFSRCLRKSRIYSDYYSLACK